MGNDVLRCVEVTCIKLAKNFKCNFKCQLCMWERRKRPLMNDPISVEAMYGLIKIKSVTIFCKTKEKKKGELVAPQG